MLGRAALKRILSGLAPSGVYLDRRCHQRRGELLPHLFTLTSVAEGGYFLWHCPAGHPGWSLATTLLYGARTFLGAGFPTTRPPGQLIRGLRVQGESNEASGGNAKRPRRPCKGTSRPYVLSTRRYSASRA